MSDYTLRELEKADLPAINRWRNDPSLIAQLGANFLHISEDVDAAWYESYLRSRLSQIRLSIVDRTHGVHIGNVNLTQIHSINRSAEFSILIGDATYRRRGAGEFALRHMIEHAFGDLNLHRVWLHVLADNSPARAMYEKHRFQHEGVMRSAVFKNGDYRDMVIMSRLRAD